MNGSAGYDGRVAGSKRRVPSTAKPKAPPRAATRAPESAGPELTDTVVLARAQGLPAVRLATSTTADTTWVPLPGQPPPPALVAFDAKFGPVRLPKRIAKAVVLAADASSLILRRSIIDPILTAHDVRSRWVPVRVFASLTDDDALDEDWGLLVVETSASLSQLGAEVVAAPPPWPGAPPGRRVAALAPGAPPLTTPLVRAAECPGLTLATRALYAALSAASNRGLVAATPPYDLPNPRFVPLHVTLSS